MAWRCEGGARCMAWWCRAAWRLVHGGSGDCSVRLSHRGVRGFFMLAAPESDVLPLPSLTLHPLPPGPEP